MIEAAHDLLFLILAAAFCKPTHWPEPGTGAPWTWWAPRNDEWRRDIPSSESASVLK